MFWLNLTATTHVAADLKSVIDSMVAAYATDLGAYSTSNFIQTGAKASWLYASNTVLEYTGSYSNTGSHTGSNGPDAVCSVINWSISDYYRGGHPRTYLPGPDTSDVLTGNSLSSAFQSGLATNANSFITAVNALTHGGISAVALGTVRFASANAWLSPPVFRAYSSASVRQKLGTQRRRYGS